MTNPNDPNYMEHFKSRLCCQNGPELDSLVSLLSGYISRRVSPGQGVTARKVLVKLLDDAERWNKLYELLH